MAQSDQSSHANKQKKQAEGADKGYKEHGIIDKHADRRPISANKPSVGINTGAKRAKIASAAKKPNPAKKMMPAAKNTARKTAVNNVPAKRPGTLFKKAETKKTVPLKKSATKGHSTTLTSKKSPSAPAGKKPAFKSASASPKTANKTTPKHSLSSTTKPHPLKKAAAGASAKKTIAKGPIKSSASRTTHKPSVKAPVAQSTGTKKTGAKRVSGQKSKPKKSLLGSIFSF